MATQKFTYTIKHPSGIAVTLFSINYKPHYKDTLDEKKEYTDGIYIIKGDLELTSSKSSISVRIEVVGDPNLKFSYNIKYNNKAVFPEDVELTTSTEGVLNDTRKNIPT